MARLPETLIEEDELNHYLNEDFRKFAAFVKENVYDPV